jgi:hypothetical protein
MIHKELTCQILIQLRKMLKEQQKNLGGYNQLAGQGICSRFRAPMPVGDGTNQQKWTCVLGARATWRDSTMEEFIRTACRVGLPVILFIQVFQKGGSSSHVFLPLQYST